MNITDSIDIWRVLHPTTAAYTWFNLDKSKGSRLDMIWIPSSLSTLVNTCEIGPYIHSDHHYIYLSINHPINYCRGAWFWKFNTSLLDDKDYITLVQDIWKSWQKKKAEFHSPSSWWDAVKYKLKHLSKKHRRKLAKQCKTRKKRLNHMLWQKQRRIESGDSQASVEQEATVRELEAILQNELKWHKNSRKAGRG